MRFRAVILIFACAVLQAAPFPAVEQLSSYDQQKLWNVINGSFETKRNVLRWHVNAGQNSTLSLNPDHALFARLRYYDRLQFEFRIAGGEIDSLEFAALGHVSGAREYKQHQWNVGLLTTEKNVWHFRELDLARPNWMPWDNPDGEPVAAFFRFGAIAVSPGTIIELRNVRVVRNVVYVKPFYELPVTWPIQTNNTDRSVSYKIDFQLLNMSGKPDDIIAQIQSKHTNFTVSLDGSRSAPSASIDSAAKNLKAGKTATFTVTASISQTAVANTPELYEEPLRVRFFAKSQPDADTIQELTLVRPLSPNYHRQTIVPNTDLNFIREKLRSGDSRMRQLVNYDDVIAAADDFCSIRLDHIPGGHVHVLNDYPRVPNSNRPLKHGSYMPEVVDDSGTFRESGTLLAQSWWKEYLGYSGQIPERLGRAYLLTGNEKYAKKAIELLELYGRQYSELDYKTAIYDPPWNSGPTVLCSSRIAGGSTYGSNWNLQWLCKMCSMIADSPSWTPEARWRVYTGFVLPYATELAKFPGGISNMTDITDHNLLLLGLAFNDAHLVRWATRTDPGLLSRLRDIDADGFSSEGRPLNYHLAAMAEYLPALVYLENCGLNFHYEKEKLLAAMRMPFERANLTGYVPITGDNGNGNGMGPQFLADDLISIFPNEHWLYDVGTASTLAKKIYLYKHPEAQSRSDNWRKFLDPNPKLFPSAGFAILRSGDTAENQIMVTFDYGRNPFHAALDRNQITVSAFGTMFSHGPGALYNAGSAGQHSNNPHLNAFCSHDSLGHNVVLVDMQNQQPAIGKLLAWNADPKFQFAVARVEGIAPGVSHTRAVALRNGIIIVLDQLDSSREHTYDFAYHNFGELKPIPSTPAKDPLGKAANYENIEDLRRLTGFRRGNGTPMIKLEWNLTDQSASKNPMSLHLWHAANSGDLYIGKTGMNNPNTGTVPDTVPSLFHRIHAKRANFITVLEPAKSSTRIASVHATKPDAVTVTLSTGESFEVALSGLVKMAHSTTTTP